MSLEDKITTLTDIVTSLEAKFDALETRHTGGTNYSGHSEQEEGIFGENRLQGDHSYANTGQTLGTRARPGPVTTFGPVSTSSDIAEGSIQEEFQTIKDSLQKVKLPADQKLNDSRVGINRAEQPLYNVVSKCGRYIETAIKWVGIQEPGKVSQEDLVTLHNILLANLRYLQSEYQALLVQSQFDKDTSRFFRSLQKDNNNFSETALRNLRAAVEVSSLRGRPAAADRGFYRGNSPRGRGFYRGNSPRNFNTNYRSDPFNHLSQRNVSRSPQSQSLDDAN